MTTKKGFTLIEVLIVVIILGILATLAVPQFTRMISRARMAEAWAGLGTVRTAQALYWAEKSAYAGVVTDLNCDSSSGDFNFTVTGGGATFTATATGVGDAAGLIASMTSAGVRTCTIP